MKVLLTTADLYKNTGGGQTVYQKIINVSQDIEFWYPRLHEPEDAKRPANARSFFLKSRRALFLNTPPPHPSYVKNALEEADALARSVAGEAFDIVEIPDFSTFGTALREACLHHDVKVGRYVIAMHGNISKSIEMNWGSAGDNVLELKLLEKSQFETADGVYGISRRYISEWQQIVDRDVHYIDPAHFVDCSLRGLKTQSSAQPSLYCIGRSERRKGNDLFVELVRWLDPNSELEAKHIGPCDASNGVSSDYYLENIAAARGCEVPHLPSLSHDELSALYETPAIIILPTRYDTLNLVALEALFSGCPIAVSNRAGVCDYLDETHPNLPYSRLDFDNFYGNLDALRMVIENYDYHRNALNAALDAYPVAPTEPLNMAHIYQEVLNAPPRSIPTSVGGSRQIKVKLSDDASSPRSSSHQTYYEDSLSAKRYAMHLVRRMAPKAWLTRFKPVVQAPRRHVADWLRKTEYFGDARYFATLADSRWIPQRLRSVGQCTERNSDALREKLGTLYHYASNPTFRCNFWHDIARIERLRGQDIMAAVYELRVLRLLGEDCLDLLTPLAKTLQMHDFGEEADALLKLYSDSAAADERVYALLKDRFRKLRDYQEKPWKELEDRRSGIPKVAVIVSLYNAATKLGFFLSALSQQTLVQRGEVEIILVDSGSPSDERSVFEVFQVEHNLSMIYARSPERETIQAAWNRGIKLAQAPYLVFLGVDETLYPEALEILADELDRSPDDDWVMGNSLVTSVDDAGLYKNDIMPYDRSGATKDLVYLETCYLSWVGGMYRKNVHDRFGYYDESFSAAGDTEFKNRILPHINVRFIDRTLGLFLNYPDGQTTASPAAEIEDSRAWYLFRTPGGVRYAFENRPIEDAETLLLKCLGYRKSYCRHVSTDIEYASLLAEYIFSRNPDSAVANLVARDLREMLLELRELELARKPASRIGSISKMAIAWRKAKRSQSSHTYGLTHLDKDGKPQYSILNDNRYEQHSWLWKSH